MANSMTSKSPRSIPPRKRKRSEGPFGPFPDYSLGFLLYPAHVSRFAVISIVFFATALSAVEVSPRVVTSFLPLYCWTANVAGTNATVENLLPPRAEPHEYAFTPGDARKLSQGDLIVVNGLGLEAWLPKFLGGSPVARERTVIASADLGAQLIAGENTQMNLHVWLDPQLTTQSAINIIAALPRIDPIHASTYASNVTRFT